MKIISKYKDYYDWVVGKYGMDEKMVLDRTKGYYPKVREYEDKNEPKKYELAICGELFTVYFYKEKSYHTDEEITTLNNLLKKHGKEKLFGFHTYSWYREMYNLQWFKEMNMYHGPTLVNDKYGIPTLMRIGTDSWQGILLKEFGVGNYIPAEEMFEKVYSWISAQKDVTIENKQTDKEKILSHGLDYVKSFRHRKK